MSDACLTMFLILINMEKLYYDHTNINVFCLYSHGEEGCGTLPDPARADDDLLRPLIRLSNTKNTDIPNLLRSRTEQAEATLVY